MVEVPKRFQGLKRIVRRIRGGRCVHAHNDTAGDDAVRTNCDTLTLEECLPERVRRTRAIEELEKEDRVIRCRLVQFLKCRQVVLR